MSVPQLEKSIGLEVYATPSRGIKGVIRGCVEDFVVEEVLVDGSKARKNHIPNQVLTSSPKKGQYLICALIKRDWDTFLALKTVANQLGISPTRIQIAGIKDAKAVTSQFITVQGASPKEIEKAQVKDIRIYPIGYFHNQLSSYYLLGNRFHITIRKISASRSKIKKRITRTCEQLRSIGGAPNFFGHQRFGTIRPITHLVGKAMIQGDFKKAALLYLAKSSPYEHPKSREARQELHETQNFQKALNHFPYQLRYERWMLHHLTKNPEDFKGAFGRLPRSLTRLFPQAYQSYLFNTFLSRRMEGELPLNTAKPGDYLVNVERSGRPMIRMYRKVDSENISELNKAIQTGRMRLALPIVGYKQKLSGGFQGAIEKQVLKEKNVDPKDFKIKGVPEISLSGRLRTAITPLNDFSLNRISQDTLDSSKLEVEVKFMLYRGSYATVVLREFMKPQELINSGF